MDGFNSGRLFIAYHAITLASIAPRTIPGLRLHHFQIRHGAPPDQESKTGRHIWYLQKSAHPTKES